MQIQFSALLFLSSRLNLVLRKFSGEFNEQEDF